MSGQREPRAPQSMEKAFRMTAEKPKAPPHAPRAERPVRQERAVAPAALSYEDEPPQRRRKPPRQRKPFRKIKFLVTIIVLGWFFVMGVLVGRGTAPVSFDIDDLRNQLVTAAAPISERIAQTRNDGGVDFYDSLGQEGADIHIADPRNYRPEYSVAPEGASALAADDPNAVSIDEGGDLVDVGDEAHLDTFEGKTLTPQVKPKTDFDGYLALKQAGNQVAQATPQVQTTAPEAARPAVTTQTPPVEPNRGVSTVVAGGDVPKGSFSVQVAAVRGENEARAYLENLGRKGFSGRVEKTTVGEGVWYRVRVGVYQTRAQAEEDLQKLIKIGIKSPMIVTN